VNVKDTATAASAAARLVGAHPNYLQLAGTNIEDFDRAMRSTTAAMRSSAASEGTEPEITA
jgi:hypothetical protein